jgi:cysteine synthase B
MMAVTSPNLRLVPAQQTELLKVESVLELIGNTPLLEINRITEGIPAGVKIYAKLEGLNPGGSVKDRPALRMVQEGLHSKKLRPGKTILDSTSGNTGIALALIGSV